MSDYCSNCFYKVKQRTGEKSCPFNSLYWHFMVRHRETLGRNNRLAMSYRNLDKMDNETVEALVQQAESYLENVNDL